MITRSTKRMNDYNNVNHINSVTLIVYPLQYVLIIKVLEYIHDDLRFTLTRYGLDDRPQPVMMRERLSIHAILNARQMNYYRDVLFGHSFRERLWSLVKGNSAYIDIIPWLRANRIPHVYNAKTVRTANEYGIYRYNTNRCGSKSYEGEFKNGTFDGQGKLTCIECGDIREGNFKDNKLNGQGKHIDCKGNFYEGEFQQGTYHGHGKYVFTNGNFYEGESEKNRYHGRGKYINANGECYEGSYKHGERNGFGKQTYLDGTVYKGKWKNDKKLN